MLNELQLRYLKAQLNKLLKDVNKVVQRKIQEQKNVNVVVVQKLYCFCSWKS